MAAARRRNRLAALDMSRRLSREDYERRLAKLQTALARIQQAYLFSGSPRSSSSRGGTPPARAA